MFKVKEEEQRFIFTNIKRKCNTAMIVAILFFFSVTTAYAMPRYNFVTINDGDYELAVYTGEVYIDDVLKRHGIALEEFDDVNPPRGSLIYDGMNISVERVKKVSLIYDGYDVSYYTKAETYGEFLEENHISITDDVATDAKLDDELKSENKLRLYKITRQSSEHTEEIAYKTSKRNDASLAKGKTKLIQKGQNGIKRVISELVLKDGVEISRTVINEYIEKYPADEIIAVGTAVQTAQKAPSAPAKNTTAAYSSEGALTATVGGHTFNYKKMLTCQATAYDLSFESTGKRPGDRGYGITASGTYAKLGTVAVDPRVIPLGTKMYIVSTDGKIVYGYCTAEDTGGAIKGNKVDLFYNTRNECLQFGRRSVNVYIL